MEAIPGDLAGTLRKDVRHGSTPFLTAIDPTEATDSSTATDVDLPCHGGGANVEPVGVDGRQLLVLARLHNVGPLGDLETALALQVLREGDNELVCRHILDRHHNLSRLELVIVGADRHRASHGGCCCLSLKLLSVCHGL